MPKPPLWDRGVVGSERGERDRPHFPRRLRNTVSLVTVVMTFYRALRYNDRQNCSARGS